MLGWPSPGQHHEIAEATHHVSMQSVNTARIFIITNAIKIFSKYFVGFQHVFNNYSFVLIS